MEAIFYIVVGFVSGSVMYSYLLPRWFYKTDITQISDDGNPGTANVAKLVSVPCGLLCLILDLTKGILPVWIASHRLNTQSMLFALVIAAPVLGHAFSPLLHFHGGKAIATSFGVLLGILPMEPIVVLLAVFMVLFSVVIVVKPHSHRVCLSFLLTTLLCIPFRISMSYILAMLLITAVVSYKHYFHTEKEALQVSLFRVKNK